MQPHPGPTAPVFTRPQADKRIAGVCSGIAAHYGLDVNKVRAAAVVAGLFGWGVLVYVILWIALPESPSEASL